MNTNTFKETMSDSPIELRGISSMATKSLLAYLTKLYKEKTGVSVQIESVGGVDAANRVRSGEVFDLVALASDSIDKLIGSGHIQSNSRNDWAKSPIAVAIKSGEKHPNISNEESLKLSVLGSRSISYSTGPSGVYLENLFKRWGIAETINDQIVIPPPGTPVGKLVATGQASLGFQQLSELINLQGIDVVGILPTEIAYITTFSAGISSCISHDKERTKAVKNFLEFLSSAEVEDIKHEQGMFFLNF